MEVHHHPHVEKKNFKEYFLEFLMIFLAVTMGFIAENVRERITEHFDDTTQILIPIDNKIVIQHNVILFEQLYSNIRFQKGELVVCIQTEKEYFQKVERLLKFLESEYDLK